MVERTDPCSPNLDSTSIDLFPPDMQTPTEQYRKVFADSGLVLQERYQFAPLQNSSPLPHAILHFKSVLWSKSLPATLL